MPICPGCERRVPYEQLDAHLQFCRDLVDGDEFDAESLRRLDRRVAELDATLDRRFGELEARLDRWDDENGNGRPSREGDQLYKQ